MDNKVVFEIKYLHVLAKNERIVSLNFLSFIDYEQAFADVFPIFSSSEYTAKILREFNGKIKDYF